MSKRKNKRPDDAPTPRNAFRVPIRTFASPAELADYMEVVNRAGTLPHTITVDQLVAGMVDGVWFRTTRSDAAACGPDRLDAAVVGLFRPEVVHEHPAAFEWIALTVVDACEGRMVTCIFDRESMRAHVNACMEAIAMSERRSRDRAATRPVSS